MVLYVIKEGISKIADLGDKSDDRLFDTNYYALSYNFSTNEGYIEKKSLSFWWLYTQVGEKMEKTDTKVVKLLKSA